MFLAVATAAAPSTIVRTVGHSGLFAARLGDPGYANEGGCPTGSATIEQLIDVPVVGMAKLEFWYNIYSYDTIDYDYFAITVTAVNTGETLMFWRDGCTTVTDELWTSGWRHGSLPLNIYRGQPIIVRFHNVLVNPDGWYNTWTLLDDVALTID